MPVKNRIDNVWEINIKTSLYKSGYDVSPIPEFVDIPQEVVESINEFILLCVNTILSKPEECKLEYNENDMAFFDIAINKALRKQHEENLNCPIIRVDFYPSTVGLNAKISVKNTENIKMKALGINHKLIDQVAHR
jgi:hypothetical protein